MVPESAVKVPQNYGSSEGIQETPVKKRPEATLVHSHPEVPAPGSNKENLRSRGGIDDGSKQKFGEAHEDSIYKSLGWDDADEMDDFA
jgi:DNA replication regulator SLD3